MNKESLIDTLLEFLAPVINKEEDGNEKPSATISILSRCAVQLCDNPGLLPDHIYHTIRFFQKCLNAATNTKQAIPHFAR